MYIKFEKHCSNILTLNSQHTSIHGIILIGVVLEILERVSVKVLDRLVLILTSFVTLGKLFKPP